MSLPRPRIRNCPICGVAMQAAKSDEQAAEFDRFECLTCHTTIVERPAKPEGGEDRKIPRA